MDKVRCKNWKACSKIGGINCPHEVPHKKLKGGVCDRKGVCDICIPIESSLKKTFKAWAISDIIDGERKLVKPIAFKFPFQYEYDTFDARWCARNKLSECKRIGKLSSKARVEKVKITVEVE
jgi:hypothetical protein